MFDLGVFVLFDFHFLGERFPRSERRSRRDSSGLLPDRRQVSAQDRKSETNPQDHTAGVSEERLDVSRQRLVVGSASWPLEAVADVRLFQVLPAGK